MFVSDLSGLGYGLFVRINRRGLSFLLLTGVVILDGRGHSLMTLVIRFLGCGAAARYDENSERDETECESYDGFHILHGFWFQEAGVPDMSTSPDVGGVTPSSIGLVLRSNHS